ncbi:hypothetical protein BC835DRAFT_1310482 [Cytidiella melzeri]|nr:hypothetical protein BC835DRAFT_1310482 [Cytidiella melzeri]
MSCASRLWRQGQGTERQADCVTVISADVIASEDDGIAEKRHTMLVQSGLVVPGRMIARRNRQNVLLDAQPPVLQQDTALTEWTKDVCDVRAGECSGRPLASLSRGALRFDITGAVRLYKGQCAMYGAVAAQANVSVIRGGPENIKGERLSMFGGGAGDVQCWWRRSAPTKLIGMLGQYWGTCKTSTIQPTVTELHTADSIWRRTAGVAQRWKGQPGNRGDGTTELGSAWMQAEERYDTHLAVTNFLMALAMAYTQTHAGWDACTGQRPEKLAGFLDSSQVPVATTQKLDNPSRLKRNLVPMSRSTLLLPSE